MSVVNSKYTAIVLHLLVWLVLFGTPYIIMFNDPNALMKMIQHNWVFLGLFAFVFYINYLFLLDRFFYKKQTIAFVVINIIIIVGLVFFNHFIKEIIFVRDFKPKDMNQGGGRPPLTIFYYIDAISLVVPIVFSLSLKTIEKWKITEKENAEKKKINLESELNYLKYQVQPHFFFNSLNNIYSLIDLAPDTAKETVHRLGKLMRYLLYESNTEWVLLDNEVKFLSIYIEIMKLRLTSNTTVSYHFPNHYQGQKIVPLILITLVENAFKHGVSSMQKSNIYFELKLEGDRIVFVSKNSNFPKDNTDQSGSGLGLQNMIKRLDLLYPNNYIFEHHVENNEFIAHLSLPIK